MKYKISINTMPESERLLRLNYIKTVEELVRAGLSYSIASEIADPQTGLIELQKSIYEALKTKEQRGSSFGRYYDC